MDDSHFDQFLHQFLTMVKLFVMERRVKGLCFIRFIQLLWLWLSLFIAL